MSENNFLYLNGDSYRGSKYSNFSGGGVDPQGNVSSAINENATSQVNSQSANAKPLTDTTAGVSPGLVGGETEVPEASFTDTAISLGASTLPYVGNVIGKNVGTSIAANGTFGEGVKRGVGELSNTLNKVSGGLIGSPSTGTFANVAGKSVPIPGAKPGSVGSTAAGSNVGSAVGAGVGSFATSLILTGDVKESAKSGLGTAAGTAIGNAILPGVGGFIGGTLGGIFCFVADTLILMSDGTEKMVQDLKLGDAVLMGGMVVGCGQAYSENLFEYKNTKLNGGHAVFEDGKWIRVQDSSLSVELPVDDVVVVYPIATESHIIVTPWFVSSDIMEIDEGDDVVYNQEDFIDILNAKTDRNENLLKIEREYCVGKC